jgi:multidrug efflux pump subunit AcrA (membrane-fusion protein)
VRWRTGARSFSFAAEVRRISSEIDAASGGVAAFARIEGAGAESPLRPGAFVEVELRDRRYVQVARLRETALHDNDTVYVIIGERLEPRLVELVARVGNDVLVQGELAHGERVIITRFPEIGPGVKVKLR